MWGMLAQKPGLYFHRLAKKLRPVLPYGVLANLVQWLTGETHEADFDVLKSLSEVDGSQRSTESFLSEQRQQLSNHDDSERKCEDLDGDWVSSA